MSDEAYDEPRTINPFKIITPGEDTVDGDDNIVFSDFRPVMEDANAPDRTEVVAPKAVSVQEPALSPDSKQTDEPTKSVSSVPTPASSESGANSPDETSTQTSSSDPKIGPVEQPAPGKPPTSGKTPKLATPGSQAKDTPST